MLAIEHLNKRLAEAPGENLFSRAFALISGASSPAPTAPIVHRLPIKFYLHPTLVADMAFAKRVLPKYVRDMNVVLAKNTGWELLLHH